MKRLLKWTASLLAILVVLIVLFILFGLNPLIRSGVQKGGSHATGQTTTLDNADLSLTSGSLQLSGLNIANPPGYQAPRFLTLKNCNIKVQPASLMGSTVLVEEINIDGLELTLEQNGLKNNLTQILNTIQTQTSAAKPAAQPTPQASSQSTSPGKSLKITVLRLTGTKVHIKAALGTTLDTTLTLAPIEIADPTNPDGRPMKIADVFGKVLLNVAQQIAQDPQLPAAFKDSLKNVNLLLNDLQKNPQSAIESATRTFQDLFKKK